MPVPDLYWMSQSFVVDWSRTVDLCLWYVLWAMSHSPEVGEGAKGWLCLLTFLSRNLRLKGKETTSPQWSWPWVVTNILSLHFLTQVLFILSTNSHLWGYLGPRGAHTGGAGQFTQEDGRRERPCKPWKWVGGGLFQQGILRPWFGRGSPAQVLGKTP